MPLHHTHRMEKFFAFSPQIQVDTTVLSDGRPFNDDRCCNTSLRASFAQKIMVGTALKSHIATSVVIEDKLRPYTRHVLQLALRLGSVHFPLASHSQHIMHEPLFLILLFIHISSFFWPPILCYCYFGHTLLT
jgi:hypothetical protein